MLCPLLKLSVTSVQELSATEMLTHDSCVIVRLHAFCYIAGPYKDYTGSYDDDALVV